MDASSANIPLPRLAVGLVGLLGSVSVGAALGVLLRWSPSDWGYILYTAFTVSAVILYILWPAMRAQRPRGERRRA